MRIVSFVYLHTYICIACYDSLRFPSFPADENEAQEMLKDLIDDREIEDEDSDGSASVGKRKKSDEEDEDDDRLEDDDYDLLEENLGVKVQRRKRFKRVRPQIDDDESGDEDQNDNGEMQRERIAERIFDSEDVSDALVLFPLVTFCLSNLLKSLVNKIFIYIYRYILSFTRSNPHLTHHNHHHHHHNMPCLL